jgi:flagellar hook assembly protein FlgD
VRRTASIVALSLSLLLVGGSAWAGEHISVPSKVKQGKTLEIDVSDCVSGDGFRAVIRVQILDEDGIEVKTVERDANNTGQDTVKVKIKKSVFPKGEYTAVVSCIHEFDAGGEGTFFSEQEDFKVKKKG